MLKDRGIRRGGYLGATGARAWCRTVPVNMPGFRGIMSVAEMRERRIKREEKEAREQGRKRVETPSNEVPPPTKPPIEPDAFRKRLVIFHFSSVLPSCPLTKSICGLKD